jgi:hypothetical protein
MGSQRKPLSTTFLPLLRKLVEERGGERRFSWIPAEHLFRVRVYWVPLSPALSPRCGEREKKQSGRR